MDKIEYLLICLAEEGSEIVKDVSKTLRFGLDEVNILNPNGPNNRERIIEELNDLIGVVEYLVEMGVFPKDWMDSEKIEKKRLKLDEFMGYSERLKLLKKNGE